MLPAKPMNQRPQLNPKTHRTLTHRTLPLRLLDESVLRLQSAPKQAFFRQRELESAPLGTFPDVGHLHIADAVEALERVSSGRLCSGLGCWFVVLCRVGRLRRRLRSVVLLGCSWLCIFGSGLSGSVSGEKTLAPCLGWLIRVSLF